MSDTRDLLVKIKGDTNDFEQSMKRVKGDSDNAGLSFKKLTGAVFAGQAIFDLTKQAITKSVGVLKDSLAEYQDAETSQKELEHAVIDVTHATREQLKATNDLADSLSNKGVLDDDVIRKGLAQLSTFGLTNDSVRKLGKSMADLTVNQFGVAASGDQAVQAANIMAKALNGNFGALEKMGIHLTTVQKELIKTGTETQRVNTINEVLAANLRTNQATALETTAGKIAHLRVQYGNLKEAVGGIIAEAGVKFVTMLSSWIDKVGGADGIMKMLGDTLVKMKPYIAEIVGAVTFLLIPAFVLAAGAVWGLIASVAPFIAAGALVGAAADMIAKHFGGWKKVMQDIAPLWQDVIQFFKDVINFAKQAADKVVDFAQNLVENFNKLPRPIQAVASPLGALATQFSSLYKNAHDVNDVISDTLKAFQNLWNWFSNLTPIIIIGQFFSQVLFPVLKDIAKVIWNDLRPALQHLFEAFDRLWKALNPAFIDALKIIGAIMLGALLLAILTIAAALDAFIRVLSFAISAIANVIGWISNLIGWFGNLIGVVINTVKTMVAIFSNLPRAFGDVMFVISAIFKGLWGLIWDAIKGVAGQLYNAGKDMVHGLANGIRDTFGDVESAVKGVAEGAVKKVKGILGIHSPSVVFMNIGQNMGQGLINGISGSMGDVQSAVADLATPTINMAKNGADNTVNQVVSASPVSSAPASNTTINLEVNVGMYAGMPVEKRAIAEDLWRELVRSARSQGIQLPMIGSVGVQ